MPYRSIAETLRQSRLLHDLKQADVAEKLGMRQSQISTVERGLVSPRLSTVEDIARILDLELMLVPRHLVPVVNGLVEVNKSGPTEERGVYALSGNDERLPADDNETEIG
jgi:transcriptional regulator with XRE-family HTH domain